MNGSPCCRYIVTVPNNSLGKRLLVFGRWAENELDAREDASFAMLSQLVDSTGFKIMDFNYWNVSRAEERLATLEAELQDLVMENVMLKDEIRTLKWMNGC